MTKKFTLNEIEGLFQFFEKTWKENELNIKLEIKSLYNLIGFKRKIYEIHFQTQDTIRTFMLENGAKENEQGMLMVEDDMNRKKINSYIFELGMKEIEIEFEEIIITNNDNLPLSIMEVLFNIIKCE